MSTQSYWNKIYRIAALAVVSLAAIGVYFFFSPKVAQFRSYQETKAVLEEDIRARQEQIHELRIKQQRLQSDKYFVQQLAHEFGYAHENETIFEFVDRNSESNRPGTGHE